MKHHIPIFFIMILMLGLPVRSQGKKLSDEPIVYSDDDLDYKMFTPQRLLPIYQELSQALNAKVRIHVLPLMRKNYLEKMKAGEVYFDEVLEVYFQGNTTSLDEYRKPAHHFLTTVQKEFKDLFENCYIQFFVRLPEGKSIADVDPEMTDECKRMNTIGTYIKPTEYTADSMGELFKFICGYEKNLNADLEEERWPIHEGMWRATPEKK
jgi:hypothetical protein